MFSCGTYGTSVAGKIAEDFMAMHTPSVRDTYLHFTAS
jgi:hypothetical protein